MNRRDVVVTTVASAVATVACAVLPLHTLMVI